MHSENLENNVFLKNDKKKEKAIEKQKQKDESIQIESTGATAAGIVYGDVSNASTIYGTDKFSTPRGHGFAAERANHLYDTLSGKDAKIIGDDNAKWGADRVVDGVNIQSKYCASGSKCISECFENGQLKYLNPDGTPMQIEVPSDKYEAAVKAMENRIKNGQVPGVTDPAEAKNIVRKGHFTYEQAKNIAKAGTIDSIAFDAVNGAIIATGAFGVSTAISFAVSIWNGEDVKVALKSATWTGLKVGGTTFVSAVLSSQLSKAGLNSALLSGSEAIVNIMGPKASAILVNAFRSGSNIYGAAAMKSAAKLLRGNVITGGATVVVLSSADIINIFRGKISGKQLFKNIANTTSTVVGGTAGWVIGAAAGSVIPVVGTIIGGIVGSCVAGAASIKVSNTILGTFIEDDAVEMVKILETVFSEMALNYLLNKQEIENIMTDLNEGLNGKVLKDMFASSDREGFAKKLLFDCIEKEVKKRKIIKIPSQKEMQASLREVLEEIAENTDIYPENKSN